MANLYYLNNTATKWVVFDNTGKREQKQFKTKSGKTITRRVQYYQSFGNFVLSAINYKGKLIKVFPDTLLDD